MQNRKYNRPAEVKRWLDGLASLGSVLSAAPAVLHHPVGEAAKFNKEPVGMWWVVPLSDDEHKALHHNRTDFERQYSGLTWATRFDYEKQLFVTAVLEYEHNVGPSPVPDSVYQGIMGYHR